MLPGFMVDRESRLKAAAPESLRIDAPVTDEHPLPAELRDEYPFSLQALDLDGLRYAYVDEGTGETLLFVHGNPTWSFAWRNFIKELRSAYRCIAVDHVGMGLSDKPAPSALNAQPPTLDPYRIAAHIDRLCRLIDTLELRNITLIGHDWGGCIGMGAAVRMPDRFRRFVMMNTAAFRSRRIPWRIAVCRIPLLGALGVRGLNLFSRAALTMAVEKPLPEIVRRGYLFPYDTWAHRIAVHRFVQEIPMRPSHPSYATLEAIERGLEQFRDRPMLLVWGERDWCFTTQFLEEWERRFPEAETLRLPDAGHYLFEDAPDRILPPLKEFLTRP
jgi:cis-3-alkyl-4-acyloxetan-2-one decarboxylase